MKEITYKDYLEFIKNHSYVTVGNTNVKLHGKWEISTFSPPSDYTLEKTTIWSFPDRGKWATHRGDYRGNWSPYIPRNLILKYTKQGDLVLDQMVGSGTTLVEAKLLKRDAIGVDVNPDAIMIAQDRLNFEFEGGKIKTYVGDARNLDKIKDESIDLIATHPPYANIITYTKTKTIKEDISLYPFPKYIEAMEKIAKESYRVLKRGEIAGILIGDTRKHKHYVPIASVLMKIFLKVGFILKEDIIKVQWNMKGTREKWSSKNYDFYLIAHEHVLIFRKPEDDSERKKLKFSTKGVIDGEV